MNHLPYIIPAYALGILVPVFYGIAAWRRLSVARRRLAAIDPRGMR
jgi:cytochrome oxidase assembly protein ShyY1